MGYKIEFDIGWGTVNTLFLRAMGKPTGEFPPISENNPSDMEDVHFFAPLIAASSRIEQIPSEGPFFTFRIDADYLTKADFRQIYASTCAQEKYGERTPSVQKARVYDDSGQLIKSYTRLPTQEFSGHERSTAKWRYSGLSKLGY